MLNIWGALSLSGSEQALQRLCQCASHDQSLKMKEAPSLAREVCNLSDLGANGEELRKQEDILLRRRFCNCTCEPNEKSADKVQLELHWHCRLLYLSSHAMSDFICIVYGFFCWCAWWEKARSNVKLLERLNVESFFNDWGYMYFIADKQSWSVICLLLKGELEQRHILHMPQNCCGV